MNNMNAEIKKVQYEIPGEKPEEKFTDEKTVIAIVVIGSSAFGDVAFRALAIKKDAEGKFTKNEVVFFGSTRGGQVVPTPEGFQIEIPEGLDLEGKDFELKEIASKKVIASGKIFKATVPVAEVDGQLSSDAKIKPKKEKPNSSLAD